MDAAIIVERITFNPLDTKEKTCMYLKHSITTMDMPTITKTGFDLFAGGTIIAINMAYKAIPIALAILIGKEEHMSAPNAVPSVHPHAGSNTRPNI